MYLSRLELFGFKSFPSRTKILFDQGMTAIVGPNGCGKTNIVDAIRWVLGEQKTSLLRGEKMEEVIFHGTSEMKPLGMAEVSLTFDNRAGVLPIEYTEVSVTRRLFRSGESEYRINKSPCRLKDIIDLFLDTGVGAHTYSVLQREMIDIILSDQAEERRFLFEEASGISKYKRRKKAAQRKLEATKNDLIRINDIMQEVEKQVNSLKRQSQKGERFEKYKDELKELEIKSAGFELQRFSSTLQALDQKLKGSEQQKRNSIQSIKDKEEKLRTSKAQLLEMEKELYAFQKGKEELSNKSYQLEREESINSEKGNSLTELLNKTTEQKENSASRLAKMKQELKAKEKSLVEFSSNLKLKDKQNSDLESALKAKEQETQKAREEHETICSRFQKMEENENQIKMEIQNFQIQLAQAEKNRSQYRKEAASVSEKLISVSKEIHGQRSSLEKEKEKIDVQSNEKGSSEENLKSCDLALEKLNLDQTRAESFLDSQENQLRLLEEMMVTYQRHRGGAESLLNQKEKFPGIIDRLSNLFTVEENYAQAFEALLGESLNFIVCQDTESAKRGIDHLRKNKKGKVTFLVLDKFNDLTRSTPVFKELDQSQRWASELTQCQEDFRPLMNILLGNALIVPSFEDALRLTSETDSDLTAVSLNGEVVREGKIIGFGESHGLFLDQKEKEADMTKEKIKELKATLKKIKQEKEERKAERKRIFELLSEKEEELKALFEHTHEKELRLNQLNIEKDQMEKRSDELKSQIEQIGLKVDHLKKVLREKDEKYSILKSEKDQGLISKENSEKRLKELENSKDKIYQKLNELRIEIVTFQGKTEQLENDKTRLGELIGEMENSIESKQEEIEDYVRRIRETTEKRGKIQEELKKVLELKESKNGIVDSRTYVKNDFTEKVNTIEEELKELREQKERFQEETHTLEMEKLKVSNEIQKLKEKIWEEYQTDITELVPQEEHEKPDLDELAKRRDQLKEKIERMGPVNLLALEEYRSQKQRLDFLKEQSGDLISAQESLNSAILTINKTARKLFLETFDKTRVNFQKVFSGLFEGGEADLWLYDEKDPLESNIGISVSPRGKKLLRLDQLSGGEKALVAISLLFAMYLVKPSPFCILDEVDAPLDDANLSRFLKLIKDLSSHTQFVMITHNKLSMEASDVLYGVTMEKPGVSKIVSVKLEKEEAKSRELRVESRE